MAGIGHRGMFRGRGSTGIIYLGDVIPGSVFNYSQQKVYSAYSGNIVRVDGVDYGLSGDQVDMAAIAAANPTDATLNTFYDQGPNTYDLAALGTPLYDSTLDNFVNTASGQPRLQVSTGIFSDDAFTVVLVSKRIGSITGLEFQFGLENSANSNRRQFIRRLGAETMQYELLDAGSTPIAFPFSLPTGYADNETNLFIVTNDGTQSASSINVYHQSSIVSSLASNPSGYSIVSYEINRISIGGRYSGANDFNGLVHEFHLFDSALSATQRQIVLDFMLQRYSLPT